MVYDTDTTNLSIGEYTIPCDVTIQVDQDEIDILLDQDFESEAQKQEFIDDINNGLIQSVYISVTVSALGLEGLNAIGGCEVRSSLWHQDIQEVLTSYDMIASAIDDLKDKIKTESDACLERANIELRRASEFQCYKEGN